MSHVIHDGHDIEYRDTNQSYCRTCDMMVPNAHLPAPRDYDETPPPEVR